MLEAALHPASSFLTLTYDDSTLPAITSTGSPTSRGVSEETASSKLPTLAPKDLQDWLKRFRKAISPSKIRYYAVGEYGDVSQRPHYHLAMFGYPSCNCRVLNQGRAVSKWRWCPVCSIPLETWNAGDTKGLTYLGDLSVHSAQYVAGYVTKKMTGKDDERLRGRHPEFARMSLRPGIGADATHDIASTLIQFRLDETQADVPVSLRHGNKMLPLGRYLRRKIRKYIGQDEKAPQQVIDAQQAEVRVLYESALRDPTFVSIKTALVDADKQKVLTMEAKQRIHKKEKPL